MNLETILAEEKRILERIKQECVDPLGKSEVISDGIVCPEIYVATSPRILWILKEPYYNGDSYSDARDGGWSLTYHCMNQKTDETARNRAFQPICYIDYGIRNRIYDWNEMPWLRDCVEIRNTLKNIAYVNVSKLPGLKVSPGTRISEAYEKFRGLILDQIKTYNPNIIFACNPHANLLLRDFGISESKWIWFDSAASIQISTEQRLVWVGHPSSRTKRAAYVNGAIKAATADLAEVCRADLAIPKGLQSFSPALRGTSYAGSVPQTDHQP
jgi:hypothetical protein